MSLADPLALSGASIPGLDAAIATLSAIDTLVRDVKVYRRQCQDLASRCRVLLVAVVESSAEMEATKAVELVDEIEVTLYRVERRIGEWAAYSRVKSLLNFNTIQEGIDTLYQEIDICFSRLHVKAVMELSPSQREIAKIQENDREELREMLQNIATSVGDLNKLKSMDPPAATEIMQSIEEELDDPGLEKAQRQDLQLGLTRIRHHVGALSPGADLTGQIVRVDEYPVSLGAVSNIYMGRLLGDDKVKFALRFPQALPNRPDSEKRSQRIVQEIEIWRRLQHPNICRIYGFAYFGSDICAVSHWMAQGNVIDYVKNNADVDRLRLLDEVASGLEYLHSSNVVHGDLCGVNVLISERGKACLSDFGFFTFLEEFYGMSHSRWKAPELVNPALVFLPKASPSTYTDIWSFGMLSLELMTELQPYSDMVQDITVVIMVSKGQLPPRPGPPATSRGLTDELWVLMVQCWNQDSVSRPSIAQVKEEINRLRGDSEGSIHSSAPIQSQSIQELPSNLIPRTGKGNLLPSTGNSSSESKGRRSSYFGLLSSLKRSSPHSSLQTPSLLSQDSLSSSRVSSKAPTLPEIDTGSDEGVIAVFDSDPMERLSEVTADEHAILLDREYSVGRQTTSRMPQLPVPVLSGNIVRNRGLPRHAPMPIDNKSFPALSIDSSASKSPGTLESVASSKQLLVLQAKDGSIEAATLNGLIDQLIADVSNMTKAVEYKDIFFTTYIAFTTADDVFQGLVRRLHDAEASSGQLRTLLPISIITVMKYWVTNGHYRVDTNVLTEMGKFALTIDSSSTVKKLADDLALTTAERLQPARISPLSSHPPTSSRVVQPTDPRDLAIALAMLEGDRYTHILPGDCISHLQPGSGNDNINAAYNTNTKIINWVKQAVLRGNDLESRGEVLKFFVYIAEECYKLRNFASMSAIVTALQSITISRLTLTCDRLPRNVKHMLAKMSDLLDPNRDHSSYKATLKSFPDQPCIPLLSVHMHDFYTVFLQEQDVVNIYGVPMINFAKWTRLHACIKNVLRHKPPDLSAYHQTKAEVMAYLEHQLLRISVGSVVDQALEERSCKLRQQEDMTYQSRHRELRELGFIKDANPQAGSSRMWDRILAPAYADKQGLKDGDIPWPSSIGSHEAVVKLRQDETTPSDAEDKDENYKKGTNLVLIPNDDAHLFIPDEPPEPISFSIDLMQLEDMMDPIPEHNPVAFSIDLTPLEDLITLCPEHDPEPQSLFLDLHPLDELLPPIPEITHQTTTVELHD